MPHPMKINEVSLKKSINESNEVTSCDMAKYDRNINKQNKINSFNGQVIHEINALYRRFNMPSCCIFSKPPQPLNMCPSCVKVMIYIYAPVWVSKHQKTWPLKRNSSIIRHKRGLGSWCLGVFLIQSSHMRVGELRSLVRLIDAAVLNITGWDPLLNQNLKSLYQHPPQHRGNLLKPLMQGTSWASFSGHGHSKISFAPPCSCTWLRKVPWASEQNKEFLLKCRLSNLVDHARFRITRRYNKMSVSDCWIHVGFGNFAQVSSLKVYFGLICNICIHNYWFKGIFSYWETQTAHRI